MTNINNWNKNNILKFSIDHTSLEEDLFDFPVLLNITESSGKNNYDCSDFFEELVTQGSEEGFDKYAIFLNFEDASLKDLSFNESIINTTGTVYLSTEEYKFGSKSLYLNSGSYISISLNKMLLIGADDFTLHGWFYNFDVNTAIVYCNLGVYNVGMVVCYNASAFKMSLAGTAYIINGWTPPLNSWFHLAVTRSAGLVRVFFNGTLLGTPTILSGNILPVTELKIGFDNQYVSGSYRGHVDEFVIIKGLAKWTDNFTPPNTPIIPDVLHKNKVTPIERKILLYERTTGLLMDATTSDNQGHYLLQTPYNTEHFIVVLDNIADYKFNPLIQDRILPNGS